MSYKITAGCYTEGSTLSDIDVVVDTGMAVLSSVSMGECVISNVDITNPIDTATMTVDNKSKVLASLGDGVIGFILSTDYIVALTADEARYVNTLSKEVIKTVAYDTDMEYEEE